MPRHPDKMGSEDLELPHIMQKRLCCNLFLKQQMKYDHMPFSYVLLIISTCISYCKQSFKLQYKSEWKACALHTYTFPYRKLHCFSKPFFFRKTFSFPTCLSIQTYAKPMETLEYLTHIHHLDEGARRGTTADHYDRNRRLAVGVVVFFRYKSDG